MSYDTVESSTYQGAPFRLYKFAVGSRTYLLTSGQEPREYLGEVYAPDVLDADEKEFNQETSSGTIEIKVPLESSLAAEFISFAPPEPMWVTVFAGHDGDAEVIRHFKGKVAQAKFGADHCALVVQPQTVALRKKIPAAVYQPLCNRMHYSTQCGADNTNSFSGWVNTWTVKVAAINGLQIVVDLGASESLDYSLHFGTLFANPLQPASVVPRLACGIAQDAMGRKMMILAHTEVSSFTLVAPLVGLQVGDVLTVRRGCLRTLKHCAFYQRIPQYLAFDIQPSANPFVRIV